MAPKKTNSTSPATTKSSGGVIKALKKKFEGVSIANTNDDDIVDVIPTGSLTMDIALGVGGVARGRIFEIAGENATGKTTRCLNIAKNAQALGYTVAFIDTEYALDKEWARSIGVKVAKTSKFEDGMVIINVDSLEEAGETAVLLAQSGEVDVIIFDSVAGAPIEAVLDGELGDANMGVRARIMSQFMPKINGPVKKNGCWMLFTNQIRLTMDKYSPYVTPGGKALPFHASQRMFLISAKKEKTANPNVAPSFSTITFEVNKNKLAPPFRRGEYKMYYADGSIDNHSELADILTSAENLALLGIVKGGSWYTLPPELVAPGYPNRLNGSAALTEMFASDLEHFQNVVSYVRSKLIKNGDEGARRHNSTTAKTTIVQDDDDDDEE